METISHLAFSRFNGLGDLDPRELVKATKARLDSSTSAFWVT